MKTICRLDSQSPRLDLSLAAGIILAAFFMAGPLLAGALGGEAASLKIDGTLLPAPNQVGNFGLFKVDAGAEVTLKLAYPNAVAGASVKTMARDGGSFAGGVPVVNGALDLQKALKLKFKTGTFPGLYRITFEKGADMKQIDFWVGERSPLAQAIPNR